MTYIPEAKVSTKDVPSDLYDELRRCGEGGVYHPFIRPPWAHGPGGSIKWEQRCHRLRRLHSLGLVTLGADLTSEGRAFVAYLDEVEPRPRAIVDEQALAESQRLGDRELEQARRDQQSGGDHLERSDPAVTR